jgi:hypothetical protein
MLLMTSPVKLEVTDDVPPIAFATGNSHYALIDLGKLGQRPRYLGIRPGVTLTNVFTAGGSWAPKIIPVVTFLSEGGASISTVETSDVGAPPLPCETSFGCGMHTVSVAVPEAARYAVIHTDQRRLGETRSEPMVGGTGPTQGTMIRVGAVFVPVGGGDVPMSRTIRMATGKLEVFSFH